MGGGNEEVEIKKTRGANESVKNRNRDPEWQNQQNDKHRS